MVYSVCVNNEYFIDDLTEDNYKCLKARINELYNVRMHHGDLILVTICQSMFDTDLKQMINYATEFHINVQNAISIKCVKWLKNYFSHGKLKPMLDRAITISRNMFRSDQYVIIKLNTSLDRSLTFNFLVEEINSVRKESLHHISVNGWGSLYVESLLHLNKEGDNVKDLFRNGNPISVVYFSENSGDISPAIRVEKIFQNSIPKLNRSDSDRSYLQAEFLSLYTTKSNEYKRYLYVDIVNTIKRSNEILNCTMKWNKNTDTFHVGENDMKDNEYVLIPKHIFDELWLQNEAS